jgi:hypothetical protein
VYARAGSHLLRSGSIALLLSVSSGLLAADQNGSPRPSPRARLPDLELDEAVVQGNRLKPTRDPQKIVNWLKLLVGQFRYEGDVEIQVEDANRTARPVKGAADCTAFGRAPGVHCAIRVTWPDVNGSEGFAAHGGVSPLSPAMIQYGLDPDHLGIRFLLVDNQGLSHYGQGYLVNDTLTTTSPCPDMLGDCQRITQITPSIDGMTVAMQFEVQRDFQNVMRYRFQLHRLGKAPEGAISGGGQR